MWGVCLVYGRDFTVCASRAERFGIGDHFLDSFSFGSLARQRLCVRFFPISQYFREQSGAQA